MPCHSLSQLPSDLITKLASYLSWGDLVALVRLDREHEARLSPALYSLLEPYDYRPITGDDDGSFISPRGGAFKSESQVKSRSRIVIWAARRGLPGTIKKVSAAEDLRPFINHPILGNGRGTAPGSFGLTPMHQAALHGHAAVIDLLVAMGADVDATIAGRLRPIQLASNAAVVQALLRHGSSLGSRRPLPLPNLTHGIATDPDPSVVECFIGLGCDPNVVPAMGVSAAEQAMRRSSFEVLQALLDGGLDVSAAAPRGGSLIFQTIEHHQRTHPALAYRIVKLLLDHGCPAHGGITVVYGRWDLHLLQTNLYLSASLPNSLDIIRLLLEHDADPTTRSWFSRGPLSLGAAARQGDIAISPETPMRRLIVDAAAASSESVAEEKIDAMKHLAAHGAEFGHFDGDATLLKHVFSLRPIPPGLVRVFIFLAEKLEPDIKWTGPDARVSSERLFPPNANPVTGFLANPTWFQRATYRQSSATYRIFELLLHLGADCNEPDSRGVVPLIRACRLPDAVDGVRIIKALKAHGADPNAVSERGLGVLHSVLEDYCIMSYERADCFQALLTNEDGSRVDVEQRDQHGVTPLATLAHMRPEPPRSHHMDKHPIGIKTRMMFMLLRSGADIHAKQVLPPDRPPSSTRPPAEMYPFPGGTPLHFACHNRYPEIVELLLDMGADPNGRSDDGSTPLMALVIAAAEKLLGRPQVGAMAKMLLDAGADTTLTNAKGETAWDIWVARTVEPDVYGHYGGEILGEFNVRVGDEAIRKILKMS